MDQCVGPHDPHRLPNKQHRARESLPPPHGQTAWPRSLERPPPPLPHHGATAPGTQPTRGAGHRRNSTQRTKGHDPHHTPR
eukprot:10336047-Prorocentrum_lima.AAC.1